MYLCRGKKHPNFQVQVSGVAFEVKGRLFDHLVNNISVVFGQHFHSGKSHQQLR